MRLRVATSNVRGFRDDVSAAIEWVDRSAPDLLLLQETGSRRALRSFANAVGMDPASDPWAPLRRRVKNAVLARPPWRLIRSELHRFQGSTRLYPRGALVAQAGRAGRRVWVVSIHLGLAPVERNAHVRELTDLLAGLGGAPIVIGGDLNATPDQRAPRWLAERYWDAWTAAGTGDGLTFPATEPSARIDYLFVSTGLSVRSASVGKAPEASDHLPLIVDLSIEDPPTG